LRQQERGFLPTDGIDESGVPRSHHHDTHMFPNQSGGLSPGSRSGAFSERLYDIFPVTVMVRGMVIAHRFTIAPSLRCFPLKLSATLLVYGSCLSFRCTAIPTETLRSLALPKKVGIVCGWYVDKFMPLGRAEGAIGFSSRRNNVVAPPTARMRRRGFRDGKRKLDSVGTKFRSGKRSGFVEC
jgi:hypothetical protein